MRESEFNWFANHPEILNKYKSEYIAIIGDKIVAHGKKLSQVSKEAEKIDELPLIAKIPKDEVLVV